MASTEIMLPFDVSFSRDPSKAPTGSLLIDGQVKVTGYANQLRIMSDSLADLADDLDRAATKPRHPGYAALLMPAATWVPCPTCRGESMLEDEADSGATILRSCYNGGCIDGQVLRQDTGA